ncbi:MAG: hypothetical protein L0Z50_31255 [Verrucomicrobiales bacterium]|nr:hypothetical protein [Verrucomicrobiales bacterium]
MPVRGLAVRGPTGSLGLKKFFTSLRVAPRLVAVGAWRAAKAKVRVLDSTHKDGASATDAG